MPENPTDTQQQFVAPTIIPTFVDQEDPFFNKFGIKLSLRQLMMLIFTAFAWMMLADLIKTIFSFTFTFSLVVWSPVGLAGVIIAILRREEMPLEKWLTLKLRHQIRPRQYVPHDRRSSSLRIEDADYHEFEESW